MLCKEASKHCWVSYSVVVSGGEDDRQESREGEAEEGEKQALAGSREPRGMPCCAWLQAPPPPLREQQPWLPGRRSGGDTSL